VDWFEGSPAPPRVKENLASMNADRDDIVALFDGAGAEVLAEEARGVVAVETRHGPAYLWVAPTRSGGWCTYVESPQRGPEGTGTAGCDVGRPSHDDALVVGMSSMEYGDDELFLLEGQVERTVRSVEIRFDDGSTEAVPFVERWFLYEVPKGKEPPFVVVGRDATGRVVDRSRMPSLLERPPSEQGVRTVRDRKLIEIRAETGVVATLWVGDTSRQEVCYSVDVGEGASSEACGPIRGLVSAGVLEDVPEGDRTVVVHGVVAPSVSSLELVFEDGDRAHVRLVDGFFLYEVPPRHFRKGHRPSLFVARDASGAIVGRQTVRETRSVGMP
jgi:hypothetical protein